MTTPSSICTFCTKPCWKELYGFLSTFKLHNPNNIQIYIMCDTFVKRKFSRSVDFSSMRIKWYNRLDYYYDMDRMSMERTGVFSKFLSNRCEIMKLALMDGNSNVMAFGSDMIFLDVLEDVDPTKKLGLSPAYLKEDVMRKVGRFNADMVWTSSVEVCDAWIGFTLKNPEYFDQTALVQVHEQFKNETFFFSSNYNVQAWRWIHSENGGETVVKNIKFSDDKNTLMYEDKPLKFLHDHFDKVAPHSEQFQKYFIFLLGKCPGYTRELQIIHSLKKI